MDKKRFLFHSPQVLMNKIQGDLMTKDDLDGAMFFFTAFKREQWFNPEKMDHLTLEVLTFAEAEGRCIWGSSVEPLMDFLDKNDVMLDPQFPKDHNKPRGYFFIDVRNSRVELVEE